MSTSRTQTEHKETRNLSLNYGISFHEFLNYVISLKEFQNYYVFPSKNLHNLDHKKLCKKYFLLSRTKFSFTEYFDILMVLVSKRSNVWHATSSNINIIF